MGNPWPFYNLIMWFYHMDYMTVPDPFEDQTVRLP